MNCLTRGPHFITLSIVIDNYLSFAEPITILLDLQVSIDDVPIGLSLQRYGPFKYSCCRLWMKPVADVEMSLLRLGDHLLDSNVSYLDAYFDCLTSVSTTLPENKIKPRGL